MKLRNILIALILMIGFTGYAQVSGTPGVFQSNDFSIGFYFDAELANDPSYQYTLTALLDNALYEKPVIWESSDPTIATIDESGIVSLLDNSTVTLVFFARAIEDQEFAASMALDLSTDSIKQQITGIEIIANTEIFLREPVLITARILPSGLNDPDATYEVEDPSILRIENGFIYPLKDGETNVTVTSSGLSAETETEQPRKLTNTKKFTLQDTRDQYPPVITVDGFFGETLDESQDQEENVLLYSGTINLQRSATLEIPTATAVDAVDGNVAVTVTDTGSVPFDGNNLGSYSIQYDAKDSKKNQATVNLDIVVKDTVAPVITFVDSDIVDGGTVFLKQEESSYTAPVAVAVDDNGDAIEVVIEGTVVEDLTSFNNNPIFEDSLFKKFPGTYLFTYTATDSSGNSSTVTYNAIVELDLPPTFLVFGDDPFEFTIRIDQGQEELFREGISNSGVTARDALGQSVFVEEDFSSIPDFSTAGTYNLRFIATDRYGLSSEFNSTLIIRDIEPPSVENLEDVAHTNIILGTNEASITTLDIKDNIGVANFTITEVSKSVFDDNSLPVDAGDRSNFLTTNGGTIRIDSSGAIFASAPSSAGIFYFKVDLVDTNNNRNSVFISMYVDEVLRDFRTKQFEIQEWNNFRLNGDYEIVYQPTEQGAETVMFIDALESSSITFESFTYSESGSSDFELVKDPNNSAISAFKLIAKNALDASIKDTYNITIGINGRPTAGAAIEQVALLNLTVNVQDPTKVNPLVTEVQDLLPAGVQFSLRELFKATGVPNSTEAVLGSDLNSVLDVYLLGIPLIAQGIDAVGAKKLIALSPYALWITKETTTGSSARIFRIFLKFQKGALSYQIEYVIDENVNGAYWILNLGSSQRGAGFQPSTISSSLKFLDHAEASIVYTNTTVNKSNFKCLPLAADVTLLAGIHGLARGPLFPGQIGNALANPIGTTTIGLTEAGWTAPDLQITIALEADFLAAFDKEMIRFLTDASRLAQEGIEQAINLVDIAQENLDVANVPFRQLQAELSRLQRTFNYLKAPLDRLERNLGFLNREIAYANGRISDFRNDKSCTTICVPIIRGGWCSCGRFCPGYPCDISVGCRDVRTCVPNPVSLAQIPAWLVYVGGLETSKLGVQGSIAAARATLEPVRIALDAARDAVELSREGTIAPLNLALDGVRESLILTRDGFGELGKVAQFIIDKAGGIKLIESSRAQLTTKIGVANSGTFEGSLSFALRFKGASSVDLTAPFKFSDPVSFVADIAQSLVD